MCGIVGFNWEDRRLVKGMADTLVNRGPDDHGLYTDKNVSLAQRRLSIIDITKAGHQPMFYSKVLGAFSEKHNKKHIGKLNRTKDKTVGIVYNGEVYNFKSIKQELKDKGYRFTTRSDTEVILASYLEYGIECVKKFNGMWAFCIYDLDKNLFFCSRDRLGQKPLYYYHKDRKFIFASELKALLKHRALKINLSENINKEALKLYFSLGYIPSPFSIYKDVYKLEASHNLVFNLKTKKLKKLRYYDIPEYTPTYNKRKLIKKAKIILEDATRLRMIADVPVGAFLSGGLDSSAVVGTMKNFTDLKNLNTFSLGFQGRFDETKYINIVKDHLKTKHHHFYYKEKDFQDMVDKYSEIYDEPFGDYSGFPTFKVSKMARERVTVSLSGDGGDEIFGGYLTHALGARLEMISKLPKSLAKLGYNILSSKSFDKVFFLSKLKRVFRTSLVEKYKAYSEILGKNEYKPGIYKLITERRLQYCLKRGRNSIAEAMRLYDLLFNTLGDNYLVKVDRASMANSLEVRSPFLDHRFAEFSQIIPTRLKTCIFRTKILMRKVIKDIVPKKIVNRGKQGFTPPLEYWILNKRYRTVIEDALNHVKDLDPEFYDYYKENVNCYKDKMQKVYMIRLFLFEKWFERWIIES